MMMGIEPVSNFPSRFHPPGIAKVRGGSKLFISRGPAIIMKSRLPGFGAVLKLCHPLPLSRLRVLCSLSHLVTLFLCFCTCPSPSSHYCVATFWAAHLVSAQHPLNTHRMTMLPHLASRASLEPSCTLCMRATATPQLESGARQPPHKRTNPPYEVVPSSSQTILNVFLRVLRILP